MRISRCRLSAGRRGVGDLRSRHPTADTHENTTTAKKKFMFCVLRVFVVVVAVSATPVVAQTLTQRGFLEATIFTFPQTTPSDPTQIVGEFLGREDAFFKPAPWMQFAGGIDVRADSHHQVEDRWRFDVADRSAERPRISLRRASATVRRGALTVDAGKQFIRWGKTDIVTPTD